MRSFFKGSALAALALAAIVGQSSAAPTPALLVTRSHVKMEHRAQKAFLYESCEADSDCLGRTCDYESKTCASTFLSNGSQCSSSIVCESGNCQFGKCTAKVQPGAFCEKDQNCGSGRCSQRLSRCLPAPTTEAVVNSLQSTMPWGKDTEALHNLEPIPAVDLYYSDHGIHRSEASAMLVNMSSNANYDAVVLTHTSLVGHITCPDSGHLQIPFTTSEAYELAAQSWDRKHGFLLVTHTHGCGSSQSEDERTFWLASQLHFDDHTHSVFAKASELAIEHALDEIHLDFGQKDPDYQVDFEHIHPNPVARSLEEVVALNQLNETDSWAEPAHFVKRAGPSMPGSCGTTPAGVSCGPNFDAQLDAINGFLDFEGDFENSLKSLAPGLGSFAASDYIDPDTLADLNLETPTRRSLSVEELQRRGWSLKKIGAALQKVTKVVAKVVNTVAPKGSILGKAVNFLAKTPLGKVVKLLVTGEWTETISGKIQLGWKYGGAKEDTPWGRQPVIWSAEKQKATSKNSGKDAATSARLRKAKGSPRARARASGSVSLYCVDCQILGTFTYRGSVSFKLLKASISRLSADFTGALDAGAQFGVVVQAELVATYRKTIVTFPLPGGFAIKDVVTIGPAALVEASFRFVANAEADLLLGAKVKHRVAHHIDLLDSSKSKTTGSGLQFTASKDLQGAASASLQAGLPLSITLGVSMKPIKLKRDLSVTAEPSVTASIMTATSEDAFEDSKLPACPLGLAWGINSGIAFSMNLLNLAKFKLGAFNANLGKGCIDFGLGGPVVQKYSDQATDYCADGKCTVAVEDSKATISYLLKDQNANDGKSSTFKSPCDGSMIVTMNGGMAGPSGFQGYRRSGAKISRQISDLKKDDQYTVQIGGTGNSQYYNGNTKGGWPNGGGGGGGDSSGGGGSTELITSSGERLMVAGGAGGNGRGNVNNYAGYFAEDNHKADDARGGPGSNNGGGGGGGVIGGAGGNAQGGYAGHSSDEPEGYPDWTDGRMIIELTCN